MSHRRSERADERGVLQFDGGSQAKSDSRHESFVHASKRYWAHVRRRAADFDGKRGTERGRRHAARLLLGFRQVYEKSGRVLSLAESSDF